MVFKCGFGDVIDIVTLVMSPELILGKSTYFSYSLPKIVTVVEEYKILEPV